MISGRADYNSRSLHILADLAIAHFPDGCSLHLAISSHNPEKWESEIKQRVEGTHTFGHLHGITKETVIKTVDITVSAVYPEGFGSIAYCLFGESSLVLKPSELAIALDIGSSTWITTVFNGNGSVIDRYLIDGGCGELHRAIAHQLDNRVEKAKLLSKDVKHRPNLVNEGILNGSLIYGTNSITKKSFEEEYRYCLDDWWLPKIEKFVNSYLAP